MSRYVFLPLASGESVIVDCHAVTWAAEVSEGNIQVEFASGKSIYLKGSFDMVASAIATLKIVAPSSKGATTRPLRINPNYIEYVTETLGPSLLLHGANGLELEIPGGAAEPMLDALNQMHERSKGG